jgi:hypothetical protein
MNFEIDIFISFEISSMYYDSQHLMPAAKHSDVSRGISWNTGRT